MRQAERRERGIKTPLPITARPEPIRAERKGG